MTTITIHGDGQPQTVACQSGVAVAPVTCMLCGHSHTAILPAPSLTHTHGLQCAKCRRMSARLEPNNHNIETLADTDLLNATIDTGLKAATVEQLLNEIGARVESVMCVYEALPTVGTQPYVQVWTNCTLTQLLGLADIAQTHAQARKGMCLAESFNRQRPEGGQE